MEKTEKQEYDEALRALENAVANLRGFSPTGAAQNREYFLGVVVALRAALQEVEGFFSKGAR